MKRLIPVIGLALLLRLEGVALDRTWVSVSHYADANGAYPFGITASGVHTGPGVAACGPSFEFGSTFMLDCDIIVSCWDRGCLLYTSDAADE